MAIERLRLHGQVTIEIEGPKGKYIVPLGNIGSADDTEVLPPGEYDLTPQGEKEFVCKLFVFPQGEGVLVSNTNNLESTKEVILIGNPQEKKAANAFVYQKSTPPFLIFHDAIFYKEGESPIPRN